MEITYSFTWRLHTQRIHVRYVHHWWERQTCILTRSLEVIVYVGQADCRQVGVASLATDCINTNSNQSFYFCLNKQNLHVTVLHHFPVLHFRDWKFWSIIGQHFLPPKKTNLVLECFVRRKYVMAPYVLLKKTLEAQKPNVETVFKDGDKSKSTHLI